MSTAPETVLEAVQLLERDGYTGSIMVQPDGQMRCGACGRTHPANDALVDRVFRFEGVSDPDDEAIVLGVRCPHCGTKAVLVSAFGPNADPGVLRNLQLLDSRFRDEQS